MMNEDRIREIANLASDHAESTADPFWDLEDGLDYAARLMKARDLKFAELIVRECASVAQDFVTVENNKMVEKIHISPWALQDKIKEHFGVEDERTNS
jgi:hypothetical protein